MERDIIITPFCFESILTYHRLKAEGKNVSYFFDKNIWLHNRKYCDVPVVKKWYKYNAEIVVCSNKYSEQIISELKDLGYTSENIKKHTDIVYKKTEKDIIDDISLDEFKGFKNLGTISNISTIKKMRKLKRFCIENNVEINYDDLEGNDCKEVIFDNNKNPHLFFKRIELDVTSRCTLKCKHCCNMMQYYSHPKDVDKNIVISDYNRIIELIEWTDDILLIGGETLLYKDLEKVIIKLYENDSINHKVGAVRIVTNGTVLPNNELLQVMSYYNVSLQISNYLDKSKKMDEIINSLVHHNVNYDVLDSKYWYNSMQYIPANKVLSEKELLKMRQNNCITKCRTVDQGKFYLCAHLKSLDHLNAIAPQSKNCYVNIYDSNAKENIALYLSTQAPLPEACSWCNGISMHSWYNEKIPVAEQITGPLDYIRF